MTERRIEDNLLDDAKLSVILNECGEDASYSCSSCGIELHAQEVGQVPAGRNCANGEFAPCPECGVENSVDRDAEES